MPERTGRKKSAKSCSAVYSSASLRISAILVAENMKCAQIHWYNDLTYVLMSPTIQATIWE